MIQSLAMVSVAPTKTMATVILSMARCILLLDTTCKRFIYSPLWILLNLLVIILFLLHRNNSKHTIQAPLFSFPSLSQPLVSFASISLLSLQKKFGAPTSKKCFALLETHITSPPPPQPNPEVVIIESVSYQNRNVHAGMEASDEEGNMSIDDTWNAILTSGDAKPVKLTKKSVKHDKILEGVDPKAKVKNSSAVGRKKKKQVVKVEGRVEGWRKRDALVILHDDLSQRAEAFIKKQHDDLKLQREESNQHRLYLEAARL
ncbi:uncharacterized protein LOC144557546 isoform X2 [Carex rostrata]